MKFSSTPCSAAAALAAVVALAQQAAACPNCKSTVAAASEAGSQGDPALGFAVAIYVMLGAVVAMGAAFGFVIVRAVRRATPDGVPSTDVPAAD